MSIKSAIGEESFKEPAKKAAQKKEAAPKTEILCNAAITKTESTSLKEIGKVIKFLKGNSGSNLDISLASKIIKEKLQK